jgi:hypothetical protein
MSKLSKPFKKKLTFMEQKLENHKPLQFWIQVKAKEKIEILEKDMWWFWKITFSVKPWTLLKYISWNMWIYSHTLLFSWTSNDIIIENTHNIDLKDFWADLKEWEIYDFIVECSSGEAFDIV